VSDTLASSDCRISRQNPEPDISEIDEALTNAIQSKRKTQDSRKHIIDHFIDDLLDQRLEITK